MMECGRCKEWIHSHCEGLSDECYQILSYLPDSVEYICRICIKGNSSNWMEAVKKELKISIQTVLTALMNCKYAKHLLQIEIPAIARKHHLTPSSLSPMNLDNTSLTPVFNQSPCERNSCIMSKLENHEKLSLPNCSKIVEINQASDIPSIAPDTLAQHDNEITISLENGLLETQMGSEPNINSSQEMDFLCTVGPTVLITTEQNQSLCHSPFEPEDMLNRKDFFADLSKSAIPSNSASATFASIDTLVNLTNDATFNNSKEDCLSSDTLPLATQGVLYEENMNILFETNHCMEQPINRCNFVDGTHSLTKLTDAAQNCNSIVSAEPVMKRRLTRSVTSTLKEKEAEVRIKNCSVLLENIASSSNFKLPDANVSLCSEFSSMNPNGSFDTVVEGKSLENITYDKELLLSNNPENCQVEQMAASYHSDFMKESVAPSSSVAEEVIPLKDDFGVAIESHLIESTGTENDQSSSTLNTFTSSNEKLTLFQQENDNQSLYLNNKTLSKDHLYQSHDITESEQTSLNMPWVNNPICDNEFIINSSNELVTVSLNGHETKNLHKNGGDTVEVENIISSISNVKDSILPNTASIGIGKEIMPLTKNDRKSKSEKDASLNVPIHVARVCKDIDDDCLSSEASSVCGSDTEIESIFEDSEEARDLLDIKDRLYNDKYDSVLQFHIDIIGIFDTGKNINKTQTRMCRNTYIKLMKDNFPWFNVHKPNIFSLINSSRPFPYPSADHIYADIKPNDKAINYSNGQRLGVDQVCSSANGKNPSSKISLSLLTNDLRKCVLCNISGDRDPEECGRLLYLGQDEWLHVNCGLWSSEVYEEEDGGLINVYVAITRGRHIKCSLCGERGATVGCCHKTCQATYHFMCARKNNSFFGSDKRIFCNLHIASAGVQNPIEDLKVRRCVFVNMDSEKKRWRQVLSDKVNVIIGSLAIKQLGKMFPDLDSDDALIPLDYCCTRLYWSTKDPTTRVGYTCRTKRINPYQYSVDGCNDFGFHKTIDHELEEQIVEKEMKLVKEWQNEVDRQQLAIQSRHTNIIPPHMCPLYRNILREERRKETNSAFSNSVCARRKLFSPTPSNSSAAEDDDVRSCLENIIEQITHSQENDSISLNIQHDAAEDDELIAMVSADESNEIMSNIVSADDNEIISMVLRDLPVIESSAPHSPPSSGRTSPLNLDFLNSYEQAVSLQELHQKAHLDDKIGDFQCQAGFSSIQNDEKDFQVDAEPEANLCQKIFDACDPQLQSQLLTMEQAHINTHCSNSDMQSLVSAQPYDQTSIMHGDRDVLAKSVSNLFTDVILPTESRFSVDCVSQPNSNIFQNDNPVVSSYGNQFLPDFDQNGLLAYSTLSEAHSPHNEKLSLMGTNYCDTHQGSSALSSCSNELLELNNFLIDAAKSCDVNSKNTNYYQHTPELTNSVSSNCCNVKHNDMQGTMNVPFMPLSSIVNGLLELETKNEMTHNKKLGCSFELEGHSSSNERSTENSSQESPFSALLSSSSTSSTPLVSSKKQVCRVLPMPLTESRRPSSASEQSDAAIISSLNENQSASNTMPRVEESCEDLSSVSHLPKSISSLKRKKGKIHMKRNYRTVIKKYPLRSSLRKHSSFKSVQIEINETIEIPSDDDEEVESKVKRKWSSAVLDSNSAESQPDDVNAPSGSKQHRKRVFRASVNNEAKVEPLQEKPNENKLKEPHSQEKSKSEVSSSRPRSHQVLKFSDDHNDITVSIVNNNNLGLCDFSKRKRRHRFRRKTVLQLDGAADESTSSSEGSDNGYLRLGKSQELLHSNLALHIKQQSLARSSPGEEGPYKCAKCKRLYRTKDSYSRHIETCTFEIDSSSPTDEDSENNSNESFDGLDTKSVTEVQLKHPLKADDDVQHCDIKDGQPNSFSETVQVTTSSKTISPTDIEKLQDFCSLPLLEQKLCDKAVKQEPDTEKSRIHGLHRQVRIAKRKESAKADSTILFGISSPTSTNLGIPTNTNEVFVPPCKSPIKFSPTFKKSASPRKYTNVRLSKGKGYQYRRAASQMLTQNLQQNSIVQANMYQFQAANTQQQHQIQQTNLPVNIQSLIEPNTYNIQNAFQAQSFTNPMHHYTSLNGNVGIQNSMAQLGQVVTVLSGPSVAVPQGYTLQYVGSYRDNDMGASATNLLTYQAPQSVVMPQIVMASQNSPLVMPSVVNTNFAYAFAAPETLVINQPQTIVPNLQYITQQPAQNFQQQIIQPINNTVVSIAPSPMPAATPMTPSFSMPVHTNALNVQQIGSSATNLSMPNYSASNMTSSVLMPTASETFRSKPQAFIAPITSSSSPLPSFKVESSLPVRPIFSQLPPVSRSVATVAPVVYTSSTSTATKTHINESSMLQTIEPTFISDIGDNEDVQDGLANIRPRPTYSYRDAMMDVNQEKKRLMADTIMIESQGFPTSGYERKISENELGTDIEELKSAEKNETKTESTQSFKLILKKDCQSSSKLNVIPVNIPNIDLSTPEVKELRIKAKVSVGPKRKKTDSVHHQWGQYGKDFIIGSSDTTNELSVNEQVPNLKLNFSPNTSPIDDPNLMDKPKTANPEPYIVFELTSEDGFKVESRHVTEVWQKVFDAVAEARENLRIGGAAPVEKKGKSLSGLYMLGLTHNAVQYLLEQLPGAKDCHKYSFQFHRRPAEDDEELASVSGCARTESFKIRSPYDIFSWLASKHRKLPHRSQVQQEEIQLSTRRATSMELPMAMRYRHLCETAREAVGVFRSVIHGRGLFCKRDIDSGEMVIEYAGQVIRSCLCDMREKFYESKGIGCYMFRIDEETVIDATMHGNAARFINHSCDPNCFSRVVDILGKKHIIIFALRRILRGEELTYDYKFPIEDDKIPCSCGARKCRKYLN